MSQNCYLTNTSPPNGSFICAGRSKDPKLIKGFPMLICPQVLIAITWGQGHACIEQLIDVNLF